MKNLASILFLESPVWRGRSWLLVLALLLALRPAAAQLAPLQMGPFLKIYKVRVIPLPALAAGLADNQTVNKLPGVYRTYMAGPNTSVIRGIGASGGPAVQGAPTSAAFSSDSTLNGDGTPNPVVIAGVSANFALPAAPTNGVAGAVIGRYVTAAGVGLQLNGANAQGPIPNISFNPVYAGTTGMFLNSGIFNVPCFWTTANINNGYTAVALTIGGSVAPATVSGAATILVNANPNGVPSLVPNGLVRVPGTAVKTRQTVISGTALTIEYRAPVLWDLTQNQDGTAAQSVFRLLPALPNFAQRDAFAYGSSQRPDMITVVGEATGAIGNNTPKVPVLWQETGPASGVINVNALSLPNGAISGAAYAVNTPYGVNPNDLAAGVVRSLVRIPGAGGRLFTVQQEQATIWAVNGGATVSRTALPGAGDASLKAAVTTFDSVARGVNIAGRVVGTVCYGDPAQGWWPGANRRDTSGFIFDQTTGTWATVVIDPGDLQNTQNGYNIAGSAITEIRAINGGNQMIGRARRGKNLSDTVVLLIPTFGTFDNRPLP